ncbi:MAG TPA: adenylate/guanylate cyclase domain-containing protein, partial [Miltoncostaeaceae bacterium]|nr:adenylate/guanylate cyclase domain-containing protein [Miltoncostaeaceae bacterium]
MTVSDPGTVTFLFTDVEGSSRLVERLASAWPPVLERHHALVGAAVEAHGGRVVNTEGDGTFAVFAEAPAAVAAAAAAQRALAAEPWPAPLRVRMGLHTGEGVRGGRDYVGPDVHRAARVAEAGHGGQVLVSAATRARVDGHLPEGLLFEDLGEHGLRGLGTTERLAQLVIPGSPTEFPALRTVRARPGVLPAQPTALMGRDREVHEVGTLLDRARLVTVTGPGGTGKTRLALAVAEAASVRSRDGAAFVALAPIQDAALVPGTVAEALGLRVPANAPVLDTLVAHLAPQHVLLVLDNMEQIVEAAPAVQRIVAAGPGVRVLVTSRAPLRLTGEQEYPLDTLEPPAPGWDADPVALAGNPAVALFTARARQVDPAFRLDASTAAAVAGICRAVDGLPLALELAASRLRLLSPASVLARLQRCLGFLTGGDRDRPGRQQTLRATIDWSHDLLDEDGRVLFRRLGVFAGTADLEALEEVCAPGLGADLLDVLGGLVEQSLVRRADDPARDRVRMLQVIREYALERLRDAGEHDAVAARHARWCRDLAAEAGARLTTGDQDLWLARLDREHDNMRAALRWCASGGDVLLGLEIAAGLWRYWQLHDHMHEGRGHLEALLALPAPEEAAAARAHALAALASVVYWQGDYDRAADLYGEVETAAESLGEDPAAVQARYGQAWTYAARRMWPEALAQIDRVAAEFAARGDEVGVAHARGLEGMVAHRSGDVDRGLRAMREALAMLERHDEPWWTANAHHGLGKLLVEQGLCRAREHDGRGGGAEIGGELRQRVQREPDAGHVPHGDVEP